MYGSKPIVQLTISGEELLLRQWSHKFMPDLVKKAPERDGAGPGNDTESDLVGYDNDLD